MNSYAVVFIWYIIISTTPNHVSLAAPLNPGLVTKLLTALNSLKAALPSASGPGSGEKSSGDAGNSDKKAGQPTSFHMDDRSPEIEVKTSDMGMDIKTKPASLQVLSTPVEPVHVHEVIEDHNILGVQPHFIAPPEVIHPIQPVYYGGRRHHIHPFMANFHHNLHHSYGYFPFRQFYYPSHQVLYHEGDSDGDDDDDDDEDGEKKGRIPKKKKHDKVWHKLKAQQKHKRFHKYATKRDLRHSSVMVLNRIW